MERFRITIASLPNKEQLVAEIFYDGVQWAEISQVNANMMVQIYNPPQQSYWEFSLEIALSVLHQARIKLLFRIK